MFSTFRKRLLFWFLIFICSSLIIIGFSIAYLYQREQINQTTDLIEDSHRYLLQKVVTQQSFLSLDTKNGIFFQSGISSFLKDSYSLSDTTLALMNQASASVGRSAVGIKNELNRLEMELKEIDSIFAIMVQKIISRGYKDYRLEGSMRDDAHWLEDIDEIPNEAILSLRRHEKDYIIRNESKYVDQLNALVTKIQNNVNRNRRIRSRRREEISERLNSYQEKFNRLVELDSEIGIKDNSGLKKELDENIQQLEAGFKKLVVRAQERKQTMFYRLNLIFLLITALFLGGSLYISAYIAQRITQPLTDLTIYITRFVDSNFTLEDENPRVRTKDEIGKLTQNFSILKDEIISQLKFFKEKVDERTKELATANQRLVNINEANSRFVPKEFLHFLGKRSIEEVLLGDQIQQEMTILFVDIRSFTKISETLSPQENFDFINAYLNNVVPIIRRNNGIIDKFIGDNVMALFPDNPQSALQAALEFDNALRFFNDEQKKLGHQPIQIGTGIHTGQLILGTIGNQQRLETTVISDAVNISSRVEGLTKFYNANVIFTEETLNKLPEDHDFYYRFLDNVKVKGKSKTISIFELLSSEDFLKLSYQRDYHKAIKLMRARNIEEALSIFNYLLELNPNDGALQVMSERCKEYLEKGIPDDWDGVKQMKEK